MYKSSPISAALFLMSMMFALRGGSAFKALGGRFGKGVVTPTTTTATTTTAKRTINSSTALFAEVKRMSAGAYTGVSMIEEATYMYLNEAIPLGGWGMLGQ